MNENDKGGEIEVSQRDNGTLMALQRAEIDQQVATAKAYPRSISKFKSDLLGMVTLDKETAESMFFALPRDGKLIEGETIRMAEIAGSCWGNVRYGARVIEVGDTFLTARGVCYDLERNVGIEIDVRRRITTKNGKRYGDDMIGTTGNAACSIALRNAIFKIVPRAYIKPAMLAAKRVAAGDAKTLVARRDAALLWFKGKGIPAAKVFTLLEVAGADEITLDHLSQLLGITTAVKDGEATLAEFFVEPEKAPAATTTSAKTNGGAAPDDAIEALKRQRQQATAGPSIVEDCKSEEHPKPSQVDALPYGETLTCTTCGTSFDSPAPRPAEPEKTPVGPGEPGLDEEKPTPANARAAVEEIARRAAAKDKDKR